MNSRFARPPIARSRPRRSGLSAGAVAGALLLASCTDLLLPRAPADELRLDGTLDGLSSTQLALHARGDQEFARRFAEADGLGPLFVASACESCHVGEGKGHPLFDITRFGRATATGFDPMVNEGGPQLQNRAIAGYLAEVMPSNATASARFTAPSVTGLGLLEAVDDATIRALADPDDADGDGISGRVSLIDSTEFLARVIALSTGGMEAAQTRHMPIRGKYVGRFGKKARIVTLLQQTVSAYSEDMGITTELIPQELYNRQTGTRGGAGIADPEISGSVVNAVVFYLRTLRAPPRRDTLTTAVKDGARLFIQSNCSACHVLQIRTGMSDISQLNRVTFSPFTDLLLHDMGAELNDGYTEGDALPAEWRTAPLWGIGVAERSQGGGAHYLHDGRASTLRDAIRFHGGEGVRSRAAFDKLTVDQQERLLAYLRSL